MFSLWKSPNVFNIPFIFSVIIFEYSALYLLGMMCLLV